MANDNLGFDVDEYNGIASLLRGMYNMERIPTFEELVQLAKTETDNGDVNAQKAFIKGYYKGVGRIMGNLGNIVRAVK